MPIPAPTPSPDTQQPPPEHGGGRLLTLLPAAVVVATAILLLYGTPAAVRQFSHDQTVHQVREAGLRLASPAGAPPSGSILDQLNEASRDVATFVRPSVVHISAQEDMESGQPYSGISTGSGWIWDDNGHILTNWHVVADADRIDVQLHDGTVRPARLVGRDPSTDIAVIRIPEGQLVPATRSPDGHNIQQGSLVFAFGSPLDFRFSMSQGIVSGLGRSVGLFRNRRSMGYENFIQVDAAINPGNSGGPLTNHRGEVIGMNTAIATMDNEAEGRFSGIGLAIPLDMIESVATQLITGGIVRKGYLGINVVDQTSPLIRWLMQMGFNPNLSGVVVSTVGSRMATAGLVTGDVITHYDSQLVSDPNAFWEALASDEDDKTVLSIWRANPDQETAELLEITCGRPLNRHEADMQLLDLVDDLSSFYRDIGFNRTGVLVVKTIAGKPARLGGLRAGDIICSINGRDMHTVEQLRSTISTMLPDSVVEVDTWRWDPTASTGNRMLMKISLVELDQFQQ
ncbi:MAG: trypsin-like peptidase domain-containing protein [Phycisphaerales bacterium]|nr:trypsin-like peptidase domain-containing protein [Phycisphaerales bacterium]